MATAFDRMAERIQGLILAQQEMLGHISHELRSPLTRIGVSLELLRRGEAESLDQMQLDLDRLNQMIGEILQITRMDLESAAAGRKVLQARVELGPMLAGIARDAAFEAQAMGTQIELSVEADCVVLGDEEMLRSCCENVVRNALLYAPQGRKIRIGVSHGVGETVAIVIQDEGDGVPDEALPHLFELFYRVGDSPEKHPSGTGFGLAIAKRIVAMHGGTIGANNMLPHGLEVRIIVPGAGAGGPTV
jgi:signal transduction histidine kinase